MRLHTLKMALLQINLFFISNIIRVLWYKVRETYAAGESDGMRKSVRAAFMLLLLLGGPTLLDTVHFDPGKTNKEVDLCIYD